MIGCCDWSSIWVRGYTTTMLTNQNVQSCIAYVEEVRHELFMRHFSQQTELYSHFNFFGKLYGLASQLLVTPRLPDICQTLFGVRSSVFDVRRSVFLGWFAFRGRTQSSENSEFSLRFRQTFFELLTLTCILGPPDLAICIIEQN